MRSVRSASRAVSPTAGTLAAGLTDSQYDALWDQFSNADSAYAGIQAYITSIQTILTAYLDRADKRRRDAR